MTPPSSAHVQLDDVPRTPIQPSFEGEVEEDSIQQQHNGVVVMEERGNPARREEGDGAGAGRPTRLGFDPVGREKIFFNKISPK